MKKHRNKPTTERLLIDKIMKHWESQIWKGLQADREVNEIIEHFAYECGIDQSKLNGDVFTTVSNMTNSQKRLLCKILTST